VAAAVAVAVTGVAASAASGAHLRAIVPPAELRTVTGRFEQVTWLSTAVGPPLGGAKVGVLGPAVAAASDALSYLFSAAFLRRVRVPEPAPPERTGSRLADLGRGWRAIGADPELRALLANNALVAALIMATAPLMAHLMLGELGCSPF